MPLFEQNSDNGSKRKDSQMQVYVTARSGGEFWRAEKCAGWPLRERAMGKRDDAICDMMRSNLKHLR